MQQERDYRSVAVLEWESLKVEHVLALEDCDGEFAQTAPVYREPPAQQDRAQLAEELCMVHAQLDVANGIIRTVNRREKAQAQKIGELEEALLQVEETGTQALEEEVAALQEQMAREKQRARNMWDTHCKFLAEQDSILAEREEGIASLQRQLAALCPTGRTGHTAREPSIGSAWPHPNEHTSTLTPRVEEVPRPCQGARTLPLPTTVDEGHSLPREPPQALPDRSAASGDTRQR